MPVNFNPLLYYPTLARCQLSEREQRKTEPESELHSKIPFPCKKCDPALSNSLHRFASTKPLSHYRGIRSYFNGCAKLKLATIRYPVLWSRLRGLALRPAGNNESGRAGDESRGGCSPRHVQPQPKHLYV